MLGAAVPPGSLRGTRGQPGSSIVVPLKEVHLAIFDRETHQGHSIFGHIHRKIVFDLVMLHWQLFGYDFEYQTAVYDLF